MLPPADLSIASEPFRVGTETFRSPALEILLRHLQTQRKHYVLDLGPACGSNVEFLARFGCKLYIADLLDGAFPGTRVASEPPRAGREVHDRLPVAREDAQFDVILAWDLFNYIRSDALQALCGRLRQLRRQGGVLFALISTRSRIPAEPMRFRIVDDRHLSYEVSSLATRRSPRYVSSEMERLLPGFRVTRSFLLRNGMQEYVFTLS